MNPPLWLAGSLGTHRRGRIIADCTGAIPVERLPDEHGLCMIFGGDFQRADREAQRTWIAWADEPGRALLLLPPFELTDCELPVRWSVVPRGAASTIGAPTLHAALAQEVRYELRGKLRIAGELDGEWADHAINTASYRRHPHAGLFVVTTLPLWSLPVLNHRDEATAWLGSILDLAPAPTASANDEAAEAPLGEGHFALLLYLIGGRYADRAAALAGLAASTIFNIDPVDAPALLDDLVRNGLVAGARVTERGRAVLMESSYAVYAVELERMGEQL